MTSNSDSLPLVNFITEILKLENNKTKYEVVEDDDLGNQIVDHWNKDEENEPKIIFKGYNKVPTDPN